MTRLARIRTRREASWKRYSLLKAVPVFGVRSFAWVMLWDAALHREERKHDSCYLCSDERPGEVYDARREAWALAACGWQE